ncbi:MAG: O-antigen ligase family protein [Oscillospiraceae bacterium]|nr:O-antigen ligase family protein [Oscillospiraceae bacterium]
MNNFAKIRIDFKKILMFTLIFPFYQINAIKSILPGLSRYLLLADIFIVLALYIYRGSLSKPTAYLAMFCVVLVFANIINGESVINALYYGGQILGFCMLHEIYLSRNNGDSLSFLKIERNYLAILATITLFFQVFNQDFFGHSETSDNFQNFFVSDNYLGYYYIPLIALSIYLDYLEGEKVKKGTVLIIAILGISVFYAWSAKTVIGLALAIIFVVIYRIRGIRGFFTPSRLLIIYIILFLGIVVFNFQYAFSDIIETVLQKDASLTGRVYIWASAIKQIISAPFVGHGVDSSGTLSISMSTNGILYASHNLVLEILIQTGFIGLLMYVGFLFTAVRNSWKNRNDSNQEIVNLLVIFIFIVYVMYLASHTLYIVGSYMPILLCAFCFDSDNVKIEESNYE